MFTVEVEDLLSERLDRMAAAVRPGLQGGTEQLAALLTTEMHETAPLGRHFSFGGAPVPGGHLRESLRFATGDLGATLMGARYGLFVIGGTDPHPIVGSPRLSFYWQRVGHGVHRARVQHPGTRPNDFRLAAIDAAYEGGTLMRLYDQILASILEGDELGGTG